MTLNIAFQMDDITSIDITRDSTYAIALEAQNRGYKIFYYSPETLALEDHHATASIQPIKLQKDSTDFVSFLGSPTITNLSDMDIIWIRQDPPFDMRYITSTYILERIAMNTLLLNNPTEIRNSPEKLFAHYFAEFMPATLITEDTEQAVEFLKKNNNLIIKPLYACGGEGIKHFTGNANKLREITEEYKRKYQCPFILQAYIENIDKGDKRIILINGKPVGAVLRVPPKGQTEANFHMGGEAHKTNLTDREKDICDTIGPILRDRGLFFVGIDVIDGYLTEINVTSPTGIHEINKLDKIYIEVLIWDEIEKKINK